MRTQKVVIYLSTVTDLLPLIGTHAKAGVNLQPVEASRRDVRGRRQRHSTCADQEEASVLGKRRQRALPGRTRRRERLAELPARALRLRLVRRRLLGLTLALLGTCHLHASVCFSNAATFPCCSTLARQASTCIIVIAHFVLLAVWTGTYAPP